MYTQLDIPAFDYLRMFYIHQGPPNSTIDVTFDSFDVDNEGDCQWCSCDYLETKVYGFDRVGQRWVSL